MKLPALVASLFTALALTITAPASAQAVLKVGSTPTGSPFTFLDTKTNTIDGVMADIVKAVGKEAGFEVQIEAMQFSTLISSLTTKRIDLISAAMFITPVRLEVVDFSQPIYSYGEGVWCRWPTRRATSRWPTSRASASVCRSVPPSSTRCRRAASSRK
jgi:polar amino acid transport system substrate-binding protein